MDAVESYLADSLISEIDYSLFHVVQTWLLQSHIKQLEAKGSCTQIAINLESEAKQLINCAKDLKEAMSSNAIPTLVDIDVQINFLLANAKQSLEGVIK